MELEDLMVKFFLLVLGEGDLFFSLIKENIFFLFSFNKENIFFLSSMKDLFFNVDYIN